MKLLYELDVYNLAEKFSDMIWYDYDQWTQKVQFSIGYQVLRSVDSIAANIAEGYGRFSIKDRVKFYIYSRGSFEETKCWLRKLIRREIISEKRTQEYMEVVNELGPKLNKFITSSRNQIGKV